MTITNERLRKLRDELETWQDYYDAVDDKEPHEMFVMAEIAVTELLAAREAVPGGGSIPRYQAVVA